MAARRALVLLLFLCLSAPLAGHASEDGLRACTAQLDVDPGSEESARCFHQAGQAPGSRQPAIRRMEDLRKRYPDHPWLPYYLGHLRWTEPEASEALFEEAARGFQAHREDRGEILARDSRERVLMQIGRAEEADREVSRAVQVADRSADPRLRLRARLLEARHLLSRRRDIERAYFLIRQAEAAAFPDAGYPSQRDCLLLLGNVSLELGRVYEARNAFRRLVRLSRGMSDRFAEATASYSLTRSLTDEIAELPREDVRREALASARQALEAAQAAGHRSVEAKAHLVLGMLSSGSESRDHLKTCAGTAPSLLDRSYCLDLLARRLADADPQRAAALLEEASVLARESDDPEGLAAVWRERMRLAWKTSPPEQAALSSGAALQALEALRETREGPVSAERRAASADDSYWLSGRLFEAGLLERAFDVTERLRARALVGALEAARARPAETEPVLRLRQRRAAVLGEIAARQRRLLDPGVPPWEKAEAHHALEGLELEEAELRRQLAQTSPALSSLLRPEAVSLKELRSRLASDEALLSFQVAPWTDWTGDFGGGSWLLAVTRSTSRVYRLDDRVKLRPAVALFTGLFEGRAESADASCAGLYKSLLAPALRELPKGIRRLIVLPDDALNRLPFGALCEASRSLPLALRYEISTVPSATLWLRWKGDRPSPARVPVLALADPPLPGAERGLSAPPPSPERGLAAVFSSGMQLGPLPYSRKEIRSVVRALDRGSVSRQGEEASEAFVKSHPLTTYGILHFATHAVTDEVDPDRSGVLLAPGDEHEDGLLQIREIVDLDLKGRVVVLSACSSNTGALLKGEGVMSLARAFFQAGAHTVVASLWRLRDDEAADFFERFYHHLGQGMSVSAALRAAQRSLIAEGAPAAAWAGLVVLGDGGLVPLPGGPRGTPLPLWSWGLLGVLLLLLLSLLGARHFRS